MDYQWKSVMDVQAILAGIESIANSSKKLSKRENVNEARDLIEREMVRLHRALAAWKKEEEDSEDP